MNTNTIEFWVSMYSVAEIRIILLAAIVGGVISKAVGGFDKQLIGLLIFMGIDYATGMYAAFKTKTFWSVAAFKGLAKKASIVGIVAFCYGVDCMLKIDVCRYAAIAGFGIMEALSIIENADRGGWGSIFPVWIRDRLQVVKSERKLGGIDKL